MTLTQAAAILGVTPDNLRGAIARGTMKAAKHGRDWWVDPKEVERYRVNHLRGTRRTHGDCDYNGGPGSDQCPHGVFYDS